MPYKGTERPPTSPPMSRHGDNLHAPNLSAFLTLDSEREWVDEKRLRDVEPRALMSWCIEVGKVAGRNVNHPTAG